MRILERSLVPSSRREALEKRSGVLAAGNEYRRRSAGFAVQFLHTPGVERHRVETEPDLVHFDGVMQHAGFFTLVLANERVCDVENDVIAQSREGVDFGHGGGESRRVGLEAQCIVHTSHGEAM